jgi:hypothetical protein
MTYIFSTFFPSVGIQNYFYEFSSSVLVNIPACLVYSFIATGKLRSVMFVSLCQTSSEYVFDYHRSDGVRPRLWTAATNRPIVYPAGDITIWPSMMDDVDQGNIPIRPPERSLAVLPESSSSKQDAWAKEMMASALRSIFVHTSKVIFTCRKILRHGASGFTSTPKEGVLRIFIALNYLSPRPGLTPRTLRPVASTLTTRPPRQLIRIWI